MCLHAKGGAAGRSDGPAHQHVVGEHEIGRQQRAKRSRVRFDVRASLGLAEVLEELRLEPLVPIHDEHGQQPTRKIDGNRLRAAEVVLLRRAFLRDDDDLVSAAAPLTRERAGVDIRPGSSEEVTVPEQDAHRQQANSEAGCRRSRNQLRVLSASTFAYDVNLVPSAARTKFINLRRGGSTGRAAVPRRGSTCAR